MPADVVALIAIATFIGLLLIEVPVAFSLMIAGALGIVLIGQVDVALSTIAAAPYSATAKYELLILPMFLLLGALVAHAGIATRIFESANRLVGWLPGGLAVATIFACTVFGGISGSSAADVATLGRVSVAEMRRHGYSVRFAAGLVAAAGTVAILIPPSIPLVVYGILTGLPIGSLLLAGVVPGIATSLAFAAFVMIRALWIRRTRGAAGEGSAAGRWKASADDARGESGRPSEGGWHAFAGLLYAGVLFVVVVGGIYTGIVTSTEAAAVGAFAALVIAVPVARAARRRVPDLLKASVLEAAKLTSMIFALLIGTAVFIYFLTLTRLPADFASWVLGLSVSPGIVVALFLLALIPLGMFLDGLSMMLLTVPVAYPVMSQLGVDGVWFGILVVTLIEIGLVTPPVGINVYVIAGLVDDLPLEEAFAGVAPFVVIQLLVTVLIFLFPDIALFLPRLAAGHG